MKPATFRGLLPHHTRLFPRIRDQKCGVRISSAEKSDNQSNGLKV